VRVSGSAPDGQAAAERFVAQITGLVSPPEVYVRAVELVESPDSSAAEIAAVIGCDPNLTARLLGLVNSCYFNLARQVDTVTRAIAVIGTRELYSLVIAASAVSSFSRIPNRLVSMDTFWRHSIYTGLLARALARRCHVLHPERLFVAGLLHDIGSLVLYHQEPEVCSEHLLIAAGDEELLYQAELEHFGFSHADLGRRLASDWKLPDTLAAAIGGHHRPELAAEAVQEASLIYLAERLANGLEAGNFCGQPVVEDPQHEVLQTAVELDPAILEAAREEAAEQFPQAVRALAG
jgi:putative nucleotidyltransferase with HDIG domain